MPGAVLLTRERPADAHPLSPTSMRGLMELIDWPKLVVALLALYAARLASRALWNLFFSPLASIPGPRLAAVTDWWLEYHALSFRRGATIHGAFQKYGPVVRIGPNKVAFSRLEDSNKIYRSDKFVKSDWYKGFTFGGRDNAFNTRDPVFHAKVRRWSAPALRADNLRNAAGHMHELLGHLIDRIKNESKGGNAIDVLHLFQLFGLDVAGAAVFGAHFDQMKTGQSHPFTECLHNWLVDKALITYLPPILYRLLRVLPITRLQKIFAGDPGIIALASELYDANVEGGADFVSIAKAYRDPTTGMPPTREEIVSEAASVVDGGTDTISISLTYAVYEAAPNPHIVREIRAELGDSSVQDYDVDRLKELPYVNAFLKEVMRVHGPTPTFLERVVPPGGAFLGGRMIPAGTIVGAQAWASHKDAELFPDPSRVDPERWVTKTTSGRWVHREDLAPEMHASYFPFGYGVRACAGRPLAELELLLVTVAIVTHFDIALHELTTPSSMGPLDLGVISPVGMRCLVYFKQCT